MRSLIAEKLLGKKNSEFIPSFNSLLVVAFYDIFSYRCSVHISTYPSSINFIHNLKKRFVCYHSSVQHDSKGLL